MRTRRKWQVVVGGGTAALVVGLGATAVAASDPIDLRDRSEPTQVETVDLNYADPGSDSPNSPNFPGSPDSPDSPGSPDSPDSPGSPDSPDSPDSPGSPDSADSAD